MTVVHRVQSMPIPDINVSRVQEDYLETILQLIHSHGEARVTDIASELSVRKSSVTLALRTLAEKGLVDYAAYVLPTLTPKGQVIATNIRYRHNILKRFLADVLLLEDDLAELNACRIEHAIDRCVLHRLAQLLGFLKSRPDILGDWTPRGDCPSLPDGTGRN